MLNRSLVFWLTVASACSGEEMMLQEFSATWTGLGRSLCCLRALAILSIVSATVTGCSGGHGFLGSDYTPHGGIVVTDSNTKAVLTTTISAPYRTSKTGFSIGLTESNFLGPYTVTITAWNNGTAMPCFVPHTVTANGATSVELLSADNANLVPSPCISNGSDVETALISDGKGDSTNFYFTLDASATSGSLSGDFLALAPNRGMNYQGTLRGSPVTFTVYENPPTAGTTTLVLLAVNGLQSEAIGGTKGAAISVAGSASAGYTVSNYTLYNLDGSIYAQGALPNGTQLVPATLAAGQTFAPYIGMTATVLSVGTVPGESACPTATSGATVQYVFQGGTYLISYVPGCGITQYVGNQGETFTLTSVGSYPQLGTLGDVRAMSKLTMFDNLTSAVKILVNGTRFAGWRPGH